MPLVENASNAGATRDDGRYAALRVGYAQGPFNVALSHGRTTLASGDVRTTNAGGSYVFGSVKAMAQVFGDDKRVAAAPNRSNGWMLGAR